MSGRVLCFVGIGLLLASGGCAAGVPEGCFRQTGHPIPTPEGRLIYTPGQVICPAPPLEESEEDDEPVSGGAQ